MIQKPYKSVSSSLWHRLTFSKLKITNIEIKWMGSGKSELPWEQKVFIVVGACAVEILAYQVLMVCAANWPR